jgi:hypothetical protein
MYRSSRARGWARRSRPCAVDGIEGGPGCTGARGGEGANPRRKKWKAKGVTGCAPIFTSDLELQSLTQNYKEWHSSPLHRRLLTCRGEKRYTAAHDTTVVYFRTHAGKGATVDVTLAVLADYANVSQDGKLNILGVFQEVNPAGFPAAIPQMFLIVSFEASAAEFGTQKNIRIALLEADGTEVMAMEGPVVVQRPSRPGSRAFINQIVALQGLMFQNSGDYAFHILVNGEEKRAVPLRVNELPKGGEGGNDG